jgi:LacI family transcriptional regulator
MAVTIRDVAARAGVSVATVSRALNGSGPVGAATRRRIEEAAESLRYRPNSAARSLITRRTRMLGVLLPDLFGEFFSELIRGVDQAAQAAGYHLLLSSSHDDASDLEAALAGMHGRVDGLVAMTPKLGTQMLDSLLPANVPVVLLNSAYDGNGYGTLRIDSYGGARAMVAHLAGHGHERIAVINGPEANFDAQERLRGYRSALAEAGLERAAELEAAGDFTGLAGYTAATALLGLERRPTAIFATNDAMAIGALSALRDAGVSVPEEMALAGFDDVSSTHYTNPPLSSVHVPIHELGARAVGRLVEAVGVTTGLPRDERLPATLMLRRSCGCGSESKETRVESAPSGAGTDQPHHQEVGP